ncbi:MAG: MBL fold metallo-hydrolase, partial [Chitinophagaceae bacterium]
YAHRLELPYLTGKSHYPPPDPTVGGGGMARMSFLFPTNPIDISDHIRILPADGTVPELPGWRWYHTPGHSPGHVSFFRERDRTLLSGDAFVSTNQASVFSVATQREEIMGPPTYFTTDWGAAQKSVQLLANLEPEHAGTGHGKPLHGAYLKKGLKLMAEHFNYISKPDDGRYVRQAVVSDEQGIVKLPPPVPDKFMRAVATGAVTLLIGTALGIKYFRKYKEKEAKASKEGGRGPRYDLP